MYGVQKKNFYFKKKYKFYSPIFYTEQQNLKQGERFLLELSEFLTPVPKIIQYFI